MTKLAIRASSVLALFAANAAHAHEYHVKDLTIFHPWARPAAEGLTGAVYLTIRNDGKEGDKVLSAESPVAAKVELHETRDENGVMKMRAVKDGAEVKPGSSLEFKPGSYHLMLVDLKKPLEEGAMAPLTITLEKAGAITVDVKVEKTAPGTAEVTPTHVHGVDHSGH